MEKIKGNSKDNSKRKFSGGGPRPDNNKIKRDEANERQEAWSKLSPKEQLAALDTRLGKGVGATKQRTRLQNLIDRPKQANKKEEPKVEPVEAAGERIKAKERRAAEQAKRPNK
jgi:hypothetical protein